MAGLHNCWSTVKQGIQHLFLMQLQLLLSISVVLAGCSKSYQFSKTNLLIALKWEEENQLHDEQNRSR